MMEADDFHKSIFWGPGNHRHPTQFRNLPMQKELQVFDLRPSSNPKLIHTSRNTGHVFPAVLTINVTYYVT